MDYINDIVSGNPIIFENGTGFCKVGYAGSNEPSHVFESIVGRPTFRVEQKADDNKVALKDIICGNEAAKNREYLNIEHAVENGIIYNWENMDHLFDYTFNELLSSCKRDKILLTEPPMNPFQIRKKLYVLILIFISNVIHFE